MKNNPVGWFEIYVQDLSRARAFYEAVFETQLSPMTNPQAFPDIEMLGFPSEMTSYGASGALLKMQGYPSGGGTLVYFSCDDCAVKAARAAASGGKVFKEKTSIGEHGFFALVNDTEGNLIGLHSMR